MMMMMMMMMMIVIKFRKGKQPELIYNLTHHYSQAQPMRKEIKFPS